MDWGVDPARVADIAEIVRARRFPAREAEKFMLAITGGGSEHGDVPIWDMLHVLLGLGALAAQPRMPPRDAAIACMLDETGMLTAPLRRSPGKETTYAGVAIRASAEALTLDFGNGNPRIFSWNRTKRALALADFLFNAGGSDEFGSGGIEALRTALDILFDASACDEAVLKRAIQGPARFMRAWRKRYLPLQAFAELIRHRESFLSTIARRDTGRDLDPDDIMALWIFALGRGETWGFSRFLEKMAALMREERSDVDRRGFMAPVSMSDMVQEPSENPEDALILWLDRGENAELDTEDDTPPEETSEDEADLLSERTYVALTRLPHTPKFLTKEERESLGRLLAIIPIAHEQPLSVLRARAVTPWENRLVEASRRAAGSGRAQVDTSAERFDYPGIARDLRQVSRRIEELVLIGAALGAFGGLDDQHLRTEGEKLLKRWRHDRASFKVEDAELRQTFARYGGELRTVAGALKRITGHLQRLIEGTDLADQASVDEARFGMVFAQRYRSGLEQR